MNINVLVEKAENNWAASSDAAVLRGMIVAMGDTRDEAIEKLRRMIPDHVAYLAEKGYVVPEIDGLEIRDLVAA